jgi:putative tryptophan/tyrosine transport system substrate-binding protein
MGIKRLCPDRRQLLIGLYALVAAIRPASAQQKTTRIGVLLLGAPVRGGDLALAGELARLGYHEGQNIALEIRAAQGDLRALPALAGELVAARSDVLVSASTTAAHALAAVTSRIPIIVTVTVDPIAAGLSDSMARPSRNVTGFTSSAPALVSKRLELLHQVVPDLKRVAYLTGVEGAAYRVFESHLHTAAATLGVSIASIPIAGSGAAAVAETFALADREKAQAILVGVNPSIARVSSHIIDECLVRNLPAIHPWSFEVRAGALMSYGPAGLENLAGAARYIDRLVKGAAVSDLPFEEPTEIRLAINLRTARALSITIPATVLARADEVIE